MRLAVLPTPEYEDQGRTQSARRNAEGRRVKEFLLAVNGERSTNSQPELRTLSTYSATPCPPCPPCEPSSAHRSSDKAMLDGVIRAGFEHPKRIIARSPRCHGGLRFTVPRSPLPSSAFGVRSSDF
jgi:hypothetical protein